VALRLSAHKNAPSRAPAICFYALTVPVAFIFGEWALRESSEVEILDDICAKAKLRGSLSEEDLARLSGIFGKRFSHAWGAVQERRVKRYYFVPSGKVVWIVVGRERDYQVLPKVEFCTCDDFYFKVMEHEAHLCYHLIAQRLADCLKMYDDFEESDELLETLMREWRYQGPDS